VVKFKRAKQTIIIKKSNKINTLQKAIAIARKYVDRLYTHRETNDSWRFRQKPPEDFDPKSFKTEVINDSVSIVWGELK